MTTVKKTMFLHVMPDGSHNLQLCDMTKYSSFGVFVSEVECEISYTFNGELGAKEIAAKSIEAGLAAELEKYEKITAPMIRQLQAIKGE